MGRCLQEHSVTRHRLIGMRKLLTNKGGTRISAIRPSIHKRRIQEGEKVLGRQ
jgi:hypothetical protein